MTEEKKYQILPKKMLPFITKIFDKIQPEQVDVDYIKKYERSNEQIYTGSLEDCKNLGGDFLYARQICICNARVSESFKLEAEKRYKRERAIATLERAVDKYGTKKVDKEGNETISITDGKAQTYVDMDEEVLRLKTIENSWSMISKFFDNYASYFEDCLNWIKKNMDAEIQTCSKQS